MQPPTFRRAEATDVAAVVDLVESAYRGEASRAGWTTEADLLDGQRADAEMVLDAMAGGAVVVPAESGGQLVGCAQLERAGSSVIFGLFAVRPALQGSGVGRAVLAEAERLAAEDSGAPRLEMTVLGQRDDLIAYYRRRGFEPTGEIRPFPYGDERYGVPRRDDLVFVVLAKPLAATAG